VDLHYGAPGDTFCSGYAVAWNRKAPDWGCTTANCGVPQNPGGRYADGVTGDDATLDHDNTTGYGPENVTHVVPFDSPPNKPYQIWVHYYSSHFKTCSNTHPTVNVYLRGALTKSYTLSQGMAPGQVWNPANVTVSAQATSLAVVPGSTGPVNFGACSGGGQ
jgi:hypothetical protein